MIIPIILIIAGTWVLQDSIASVLYYLNCDGESWHYNQSLRCIRTLWGIVVLACGIILLVR